MKILHNAYWKIETILARGEVVAEVHGAKYVYGDKATVDITVYVKIKSKEFDYVCKFTPRVGTSYIEYDIDEFCGLLEAMGFQLGNHENETVTLTDLGEQEVSLLSSVPYLPVDFSFPEDRA